MILSTTALLIHTVIESVLVSEGNRGKVADKLGESLGSLLSYKLKNTIAKHRNSL